MKKASLFGVVGVVLLLIVVFIIFGLVFWNKVNLLAMGQNLELHANATISPSSYYNTSVECDVSLMNLLRFRDNDTNLTYGQLMSLAKQTNSSQKLCDNINSLIENKFPEYINNRCFKISAISETGKEPFLDCQPIGRCGKIRKLYACDSYVPDISPEKGWIKVEMVMGYERNS